MINGPVNTINLTPAELYDQIMDNFTGVAAIFQKDDYYSIKNAPLERYVKYKLDQLQDSWNVTFTQKLIIDGENAFKIDADSITQEGYKIIGYFVIHDNEPYFISYGGYVKNYEKYLPAFENMVRSFKFID